MTVKLSYHPQFARDVKRLAKKYKYQQGTAIIIKIFLVEEREFMRMERELKKIGPQGGRGWRTTGTNEDNVVMGDE